MGEPITLSTGGVRRAWPAVPRLPGRSTCRKTDVAAGARCPTRLIFPRCGPVPGTTWTKVLKGANPAELPIEQAAHYVLAVNLKTAKALGITVPESILLRADEVIR